MIFIKFLMPIIAAFIVCLGFASCKDSPTKNGSKSEKTSIRFALDWIASCTFAGDYIAQHQADSSKKLTIKINPGGEGLDPIKLVVAGTDDVGISGLHNILMANEKGANLVAFAIADNVSPTVFLSRKESNIRTPHDFIGKRVGVIEAGSVSRLVYSALMRKLNIDRSKIKEVSAGFDMKGFIVNDEYDVRPAFAYEEPIILENQGIQYNLVDPRDYGLNYPGRAYFAKADFIRHNPVLIQNFVNALRSGWRTALDNPSYAVSIMIKAEPKLDSLKEVKGVSRARGYLSGYHNRLLVPDTAAIHEMIIGLHELRVLRQTPPILSFFNLSFING